MIKIRTHKGAVHNFDTPVQFFRDPLMSAEIKTITIYPAKEERAKKDFSIRIMDTLRPIATRVMEDYKTDFTVIDRLVLFMNGPGEFIWVVRKYGTRLKFFKTGSAKGNKNGYEWLKAEHDSTWDAETREWYHYTPLHGLQRVAGDEAVRIARDFCQN